MHTQDKVTCNEKKNYAKIQNKLRQIENKHRDIKSRGNLKWKNLKLIYYINLKAWILRKYNL